MKNIFKSIVVLFLILTVNPLFAITDVLDIGLFWDNRPTAAVVSVTKGGYDVYADGIKIYDLRDNDAITIVTKANQVSIKSSVKKLGTYTKVKLIKQKWGSTFKIMSIAPRTESRVYDDNLFISSFYNKLRLINNVYLENYVAGVIESEAGPYQSFEYYRVQAIICRTYALNNLNRFSKEGFDLCDRVNSQVYKNKSTRNSEIIRAVNHTKGIVIVDSDIKLITAVFHSNSGGYTVNSEDVWTKPLPYLKAVEDTFSFGQPHADWTHYMPTETWLTYLRKNYGYPTGDSTYLEYVLDYCPVERDVSLTPLDTKILLKTIRKDLKLKSTHFSITEKDGYVMFKGKGFGHGVGLSQEGAIKMTNLGHSYKEVLHYYYQGIHLVPLEALDFFKQN